MDYALEMYSNTEPDGGQGVTAKMNSDTNDLTNWLEMMKTSLGIPTHRSDGMHTVYSPETVDAFRQDTRAWTVSSTAGHQLPRQVQRCVSRTNTDVNNNFDAFYSDVFLGDFQNVDTNQYNLGFTGEPFFKPEIGYQHIPQETNPLQGPEINRHHSLIQPNLPPPYLPTPLGAGVPYGTYTGAYFSNPRPDLHVYENCATTPSSHCEPRRGIAQQHQTSGKCITRTSSYVGTSDTWSPFSPSHYYGVASLPNRLRICQNFPQNAFAQDQAVKTLKNNGSESLRENENCFDNNYKIGREIFENQDPIMERLLTDDDSCLTEMMSQHPRKSANDLHRSEKIKKAFANSAVSGTIVTDCDVKDLKTGSLQKYANSAPEGTDSTGVKDTLRKTSEVEIDLETLSGTYLNNASDRLRNSVGKYDNSFISLYEDSGDLNTSANNKTSNQCRIQDDTRGEHSESTIEKTPDPTGGLKVLRNKDFESLSTAERNSLKNEMLKHLKMWTVEQKSQNVDLENHHSKVNERSKKQKMVDGSLHPKYGDNLGSDRENILQPIQDNPRLLKEYDLELRNGKTASQNSDTFNRVKKDQHPQNHDRTEENISEDFIDENLPWKTTYRPDDDEIFQNLDYIPDDKDVPNLCQKAEEESDSSEQDGSHSISPDLKSVGRDHPWTEIKCRTSSATTSCDVSSSGDKQGGGRLPNSTDPCSTSFDLVTSTTDSSSNVGISGPKGRGVRRSSDEPRRPKNGFIRFSIENRHTIAAEHPKLDNREISRILGIKWRKMDVAAKKSYEDAFEKDIQTIREEHPEWRYAPAKRLAEDLVEPMPSRLRPRNTLRRKHVPYVVRSYNKRGGRKKQGEHQKVEPSLTGAWVQCDLCGKWPCLPPCATEQERPQIWTCHCTPDQQHSSPQVKEEANTRDTSPYSCSSQPSTISYSSPYIMLLTSIAASPSYKTYSKSEDPSTSTYNTISNSNAPSGSLYNTLSNCSVPSPSTYNTYSNSNAHVLYREPTW